MVPESGADSGTLTAQRRRAIVLRTLFFAAAIVLLLWVCRRGSELPTVATVFTIYVTAAALWVRGQYETSVTPNVELWTPPFPVSGVGSVIFLGLGGLGFALDSGTLLIAGVVGLYFCIGYLVMRLRVKNTGPTWFWRAWLGAFAALVLLGILFLDRGIVAVVAVGLGLVLAPVGASVLAARLILKLSTRPQRQMAAAIVGLVLLAGATTWAFIWVSNPWLLVAFLALVLIVIALVSNTYADIAAIIAVVALLGITPPQEQLPDDLKPGDHTNVLVALGDSYMSGEGAKVYYTGTDDGRDNQCHRSPTSWASMAGQRAPFDGMIFLACSGAKTFNVRAKELAGSPDPESQWNEPGTQLAQYEGLVEDGFTPRLVVISLGGNDAGFATIGAMCLAPGSCQSEGEKLWTNNLPSVEAQLRETFAEVRGAFPDTPVAVVGYPDPIYEPPKPNKTGDPDQDCSHVALSKKDRDFIEDFLGKLNDAVQRAAEGDAGFYYLQEMEQSMADANLQLCDPRNEHRPGLNFIGLRSVNGIAEQRFNPQNWYHNSLHPNERGHAAMLQTFDDWLNEDPRRPAINPDATSDEEQQQNVDDDEFGATACDLYEETDDLPKCSDAADEWVGGQVRDALLLGLWGLILLLAAAGAWLLAISFYAWRLWLGRKEASDAGETASWLESLLGTWR